MLDAACGTGPAFLAAAERVGPSGRVVGVDYAEQMLRIAASKVQARGLTNVDLQAGDMTALPRPEAPYDAVLCVLGVFFVDDMTGAVRSLQDQAWPQGGRVAVTVGELFLDPVREAFVRAVGRVAPGLDGIQPWSRTADEAILRALLDASGEGGTTIETDEDTLPLPSGDDWWRAVMGSGLRRTVTALGPDRAAAVRSACDAFIEREGVTEVVTRSRYALLVRA